MTVWNEWHSVTDKGRISGSVKRNRDTKRVREIKGNFESGFGGRSVYSSEGKVFVFL